MICVIAMVVFGILGIFSVKYRAIAKESVDCVFRRITFRPCNSDLNERLKSRITGKLLKRSPKAARFTYKHFEVISWIFLILMIGSFVYSAIGVYNLVVYDNCNGPNSNEACVFNPDTYNFNEDCGCVHDDDCDCPEGECYCSEGNCQT
jgi:hypothetical protein